MIHLSEPQAVPPKMKKVLRTSPVSADSLGFGFSFNKDSQIKSIPSGHINWLLEQTAPKWDNRRCH